MPAATPDGRARWESRDATCTLSLMLQAFEPLFTYKTPCADDTAAFKNNEFDDVFLVRARPLGQLELCTLSLFSRARVRERERVIQLVDVQDCAIRGAHEQHELHEQRVSLIRDRTTLQVL